MIAISERQALHCHACRRSLNCHHVLLCPHCRQTGVVTDSRLDQRYGSTIAIHCAYSTNASTDQHYLSWSRVSTMSHSGLGRAWINTMVQA
jgi:hypothetical protein